MSRHTPSTQVMVETGGDPREDVVQKEVIIKITRITRIIRMSKIQRIQAVAEVEEISEEGGAFVEEVEGRIIKA